MKSTQNDTPTPKPPLRRRVLRWMMRILIGGIAIAFGASAFFSCKLFPPGGDEGLERLSYTAASVEHEGERIEMSYLRAGPEDASRLIFVHGTPGDATNFIRYLKKPVEGFECITIDRPGFGQSTLKPELTYAGQAAAIEPLLVERGGQYPILVGHSLGGPIIARAAADYPGRVGAIVILAGNLDPALEKPMWYNYAMVIPPIPWYFHKTVRNSNKEIFKARRENRALAEVLDRIVCPVVIVHGRRDRLVPFENVQYMREHLTRAAAVHVVELPEGNHFLPWNAEAAAREAIRKAAELADADMARQRP